MDPEVWKRVEALVDEALDLTEADRRSFLEALGARSPELRGPVDAFLAAEVASRGFLDTPAPERATLAKADFASAWDSLGMVGKTVGPYRVLRELGRGGMGAVFLAERVDGGFDQRVALKVVRLGLESAELQARFRSERQILARLQHPHVARLLDGGITDAGQPYFAMEYVDGRPLNAYCDEACLALADRLRLFLQVCEAVEYAHGNLVVHRDLKPSNVLVTAGGQVLLLDFGIAKVLDPSAFSDTGDAPTATRGDGRALTPKYAAPEQLMGGPITTATDVYSLGVVLYELLSGRHPYRLRGVTAADVERVVRDAEPAALSRVVMREGDEATTMSADAIARARSLRPDRLSAVLRGDLERIVAMAIRKEPGRRYASVNALATDLRRYLDGRPVSARGDAFGYRAATFVRRHRLAVTAAALVAVLGLAGVLGIVWQGRQAVQQARRAEEVKRFTLGLFEMSDPNVSKGRDVTARQLLARGTERIQTELAGQPELQAEMLLYLGDIYHHLGLDSEARPLLEQALELRRQQPGGDDLAVAEAEVALGSNCLHLEELDRAQQLLEHALPVHRRQLSDDDPRTARLLRLLGVVKFDKGDMKAAETLFGQAIATQRRHLPATTEDLASSLGWLGRVYHTRQDLGRAEALYRESGDLYRSLHGEDHSSVTSNLHNLALVMKERGDHAGAAAQLRQLLAIERRLLGPSHEGVATTLTSLGATLLAKGDLAEAETILREAVAIRSREDSGRAISLHHLSKVLRWESKLAEAEALSREALALVVTQLGDDHASVASVREELAHILRERGQLREAEELARRSLSTFQGKHGPDHPYTLGGLVTLGRVLVSAGRPAEAESHLREAARLRRSHFGDGDWRTAEARLRLAECLDASGQEAASSSERAAALQVLEHTLGPRHPLTVQGRVQAPPEARRTSSAK
jgi:eukaryotic-like serine/threonine-protein kinase